MRINRERVLAERAAQGMSQQSLAERARIGRRTLGRLERGEITHPQLDTYKALAQAFDLDWRELAIAENDAETVALERLEVAHA